MAMPQTWCEVAFVRDATNSTPLWRDVSADVEWQEGVRISRRRSNELDEVQPGTLSLSLLNDDGRYTAGNTASIHYPNVKINRQIRIRARWPASVNMLLVGQATGLLADAVSGATLWSASQGTLATDVVVFPTGQASSVRWNTGTLGSTGQQLRIGSGAATTATQDGVQVTVGASYTLSCRVRRDASLAVSVNARIRWYDSAGAFLSESVGSAVALTTTFQAVTCTATAPASTVWARLVLANTTTTAGTVAVYASAAQFEQAGSASTWVTPGVEYVRYVGYIDKWPQLWTNGVLGKTTITATDRQKLFGRQLLGTFALTNNQQSGARILSLLAQAQVTTATVDTGLSVLGLAGNESTQSILALLKTVTESEAGLFFIGRDGIPVFQDRAQRQRPSTTVLAVTADQCGRDLAFIVDDSLLVNDATVATNLGTTTVQVFAPGSITEFGRYSTRIETLLTTAAEVTDRATALVSRYSDPAPRAGQISIEANSQPALWDELLASEIGQRIQIGSLPASAPTGTLDLWIEGVQDLITDQSWTFTFDPSPAVNTISFMLDDPVYGVLDVNKLGW